MGCECLPGFVGPACSCNLNGPTNCDPSCKNGGTCVAAPPAQGKEECSYSCECVEPFTGVDCGECDPLVRDVPLSALPSPAATAWRTPRARSTLGCRPASGALRPTTDRASRPMSVLRSKEQALSTPAPSHAPRPRRSSKTTRSGTVVSQPSPSSSLSSQ